MFAYWHINTRATDEYILRNTQCVYTDASMSIAYSWHVHRTKSDDCLRLSLLLIPPKFRKICMFFKNNIFLIYETSQIFRYQKLIHILNSFFTSDIKNYAWWQPSIMFFVCSTMNKYLYTYKFVNNRLIWKKNLCWECNFYYSMK